MVLVLATVIEAELALLEVKEEGVPMQPPTSQQTELAL